MMLPAGCENYTDDDEIESLIWGKEDAQKAYEYNLVALRETLVEQLQAFDRAIKTRVEQLRHENLAAETRWAERHPNAVCRPENWRDEIE